MLIATKHTAEFRLWLQHMKKILIGLACLSCLVSILACSHLNKKIGLPDDNIIEQFVEWLINKETGLNLDLTPSN